MPEPLQIVTMSRGRPDLVGGLTLRLFPGTTLAVPAGELDAYQAATGLPLSQFLPIPAAVRGIGPNRQYVLDHFAPGPVFFADDDIKALYALTGHKSRRYHDPAVALAIVHHVATAARDAGAGAFGFCQGDIRKTRPQLPFSLATWSGSVIGVLDRRVRFDPALSLRADIDFFLSHLLANRFVWVDQRFAFHHHRFTLGGGTASYRDHERMARECAYLQRKWGSCISFRSTATTVRTLLHVSRQQPLQIG